MTPTTETTTALTAPTQVTPVPRVPLNDMLALVRDTELVATYGREIIESQLAINLFDQQWRLAQVFAKSGMFTDAQEVNQAMAKIQIGQSWKMNPADAMQFIDVANGRPSVRNEYLAAKMRDGGIDWDIEWLRDAAGVCIGCTLWPRRLTDGKWEDITERKEGKKVPASVSFTKAQAEKIRVKEDGKWITLAEKATYQGYPEDLYFSKAIARVKRRYASNILSGMMTREEINEIELPDAAPTPKAKLEVVEPITSGRQSRKKAGAEEIPGTAPLLATQEEAKEAVKVADVKPAPETKPPVTETAPANSTAPDRPWADHAALTTAFSDIHKKLGPEKWAAEFGEFQKAHPTTVFGPGSFQDDDIIAFYRHLEKVLDAPAEAPAPDRKKLFG